MPVIIAIGVLVGYCFLMNSVSSREMLRRWERLRLRVGRDLRMGNL